MSESNSFVRIGARKLTREEVRDTLPTYDKLLSQIEDIRRQSKGAAKQAHPQENTKQNLDFVLEQTTNNIAIIGSRGSGKSSVLKTLYNDLSQQGENCNILLPPIVPENMEKHMSLMSYVLGLLKPVVEKIADDTCNAVSSVCPQRKSLLEKEYNRLLETYLRLQEPYQKISVQQYSTEWEYLRTMAAVFEAGSQLISDFKAFIDLLLKEYPRDKKEEKNPLLFIFIDDIDLSAYRCADLVKTLLTYLAHPSIVTVLAGDITIFGEALTLNFLRQEEMLDARAMRQSYLVEEPQGDKSKKLIDRKKELAYDYLKKVLPPMYRHFAMVWSLENRKDFCPRGLKENASSQEHRVLTLGEQLQRFGEKNPLLRRYFHPITLNNVTYYPSVLYHIFDSTARGLVNAYAALEQFFAQEETDSKVFPEKLLLESIATSNYQLNRYQDILFSDFIQFGGDAKNSYVRFDNFMDWLSKEKKTIPTNKIQEFRLFVYLDWAARLLGNSATLESSAYNEAKQAALLLLCSEGEISEKQFELGRYTKQAIEEVLQPKEEKEEKNNLHLTKLAITTFSQLFFPVSIYYIQLEPLLQKENLPLIKNNATEQNIFLQLDCVIRFLDLIGQYYNDDKTRCVLCLQNCSKMFSLLVNLLQQNQKAFLISAIANEHFAHWKMGKDSRDTVELSPIYAQYTGANSQLDDNHKSALFNNFFSSYNEQNKWNNYFIGRYFQYIYIRDFLHYEVYSNDKQNQHSKTIENNYENTTMDVLWQHWLSLFKEKNSEMANPFYNYYVNVICKGMLDKDGKLLPIKDCYSPEDVQPYLDGKNTEQMQKILFVVDAAGWCEAMDEQESEESPIAFMKKYVDKYIKNTEKELTQGTHSIDISYIEEPLNNFYHAYKGVSDTLASQCQRLLRSVCDKNNDFTVNILEYIYLHIILKALLNSGSRYCKPEARALKSALNQAEWKVEVTSDSIKKYQFWFHCYCRYREAELSKGMYTNINQLYKYKELVELVWQEQDKSAYQDYLTTLQEKTGLDEADIKAIPKLFS